MALTLQAKLQASGINQGDVYALLSNIVDIVNELQTDHATFKTAVDELNTLTTELRTDHGTFQLAVDGLMQKLDADAGITDTNYEAIHGIGGSGAALPATITAAAATAGPATLTNNTALTLG